MATPLPIEVPSVEDIDWTDDSSPVLDLYKRFIFSQMKVEVRPGKFVPYEPHPGQIPVHFPERGEEWQFMVGTAGQRAGKTITAASEATWRLGLPGQRIWYIAPNYDLANRAYSMVHEFVVRQQVHGKGLVERASKPSVKAESKSIEMVGGSFFVTKSADNPDSLLGERLTFAILDEAATLDPSIWPDYVFPRLVNLKGRGLIISSPRGFNWFQEHWDRGNDEDARKAGWRNTKFRTADNPWVDSKWLESQKGTTPKLTWQQEFEGEFVRKQGMVYEMYRDQLRGDRRDGHLFKPEDVGIDRTWTHYLGIDIGIRHPTAAVWGAVNEAGDLYIYKDYLQDGYSHQYHARAIAAQTMHPILITWISPDSRRKNQLREDQDAVNAQDIYAEEGIYGVPASDSRRDGISLVQEGLLAALAAPQMTSHQRLFISKECVAVRSGLLRYSWQGRAGKQKDDVKRDLPEEPQKYKDDAMDALRYLVAGKPHYERPIHWSEEEGFDGRGREGYRVAAVGAPKFRPPDIDW